MSDPSQPQTTTNHGLPATSVALLLIAAAVIAGGVAWGVASSQSRGVAELKDALASAQTTIQNVNAGMDKMRAENSATLDKLRAENSASLDNLRKESSATLTSLRVENAAVLEKLRAENTDLRARLAAADSRIATAAAAIAKSQQRDPNAIYQLGAEVGRVAGASEDRAAATVTFESIEGGTFDRAKEFEYRDLVLMVKSHKSAMTSFTGRGVQTQLTGVEASIVKKRDAP